MAFEAISEAGRCIGAGTENIRDALRRAPPGETDRDAMVNDDDAPVPRLTLRRQSRRLCVQQIRTNPGWRNRAGKLFVDSNWPVLVVSLMSGVVARNLEFRNALVRKLPSADKGVMLRAALRLKRTN